MPAIRRWSLLARVVFLCLLLLPVSAGPAAPRTTEPDGLREAAYVLLAVDPPDDLGATFAADPTRSWAELSALYVYTDTTNLHVYVDLPYFSIVGPQSGQVGLVIDTTGDMANSGGASDPQGNNLTFAYTVTRANTGTVPLDTVHVIRPDVVIRGNLPGLDTLINNGLTRFNRWTGSAWETLEGDLGDNWGGIQGYALSGTHIAYANHAGVEFLIPYADLGVPPETPLNLQFFTTREFDFNFNSTGAFDTVPSDDQVTAVGQASTQHRLASLLPAPPPSACAPAELGDSASVAAGLEHDNTLSQYHNPPGAVLPGATVTFRLRTCAGDLAGVDLLVWDAASPASATITHTYALTSTPSGEYTLWAGLAAAPAVSTDQWYQFRLLDTGPAGYVRPASGESGPGAWAATLAAPAWYWPTLPGQALFLPLLVRQ